MKACLSVQYKQPVGDWSKGSLLCRRWDVGIGDRHRSFGRFLLTGGDQRVIESNKQATNERLATLIRPMNTFFSSRNSAAGKTSSRHRLATDGADLDASFGIRMHIAEFVFGALNLDHHVIHGATSISARIQFDQ